MNEQPRIDEAVASYEIVKQLVALGYPHNFQLCDFWVVDYCYAVTAIVNKAMSIQEAQEHEDKEKQNNRKEIPKKHHEKIMERFEEMKKELEE